MERSTKEVAFREPLAHSFVPGVGYFRHGGEMPYGGLPAACVPAKASLDGSMHLLTPPGGKDPLAFRWLAGPRAWFRPGGYRLAFKADYLGSHGWKYANPI